MLSRVDFSTFSFAQPFYLWLLVAPAMLMMLWTWRALRRRAQTRRYASEHVSPVRTRYSRFGDLGFWLWPIVAASLCILALAQPQARVTALVKTGADIVFLQDGSASMYVKDVKPDRWRRSMQFLRTFAEMLSWKEGDRAALALFAHIAAPQMRLTNDPNSMFFFMDHLADHSPFRLDSDPTWDTNIEEAVYWGLQLLEKDQELFGKSKNPKAFVVISDGQAWSGQVATALKDARARGVTVYVVGVGTPAGGVIPEAPLTDAVPATAIRAVLDRESLRTIARMGGGEYFEIGREPDREIARKIIAGAKVRSPVTQVDESYQDLYWRFLFAAALALLVGTLAQKNSAQLWWQVAAAGAAILVAAIAR
jgi:Ca-activated chloride channel family protein